MGTVERGHAHNLRLVTSYFLLSLRGSVVIHQPIIACLWNRCTTYLPTYYVSIDLGVLGLLSFDKFEKERRFIDHF